MRARCSGSKPSGKDAAVFAALLTEQAGVARGALVDDGGLRHPAVQAELELVGRSPSQTKTTLAAGIRAVGSATACREVASARRAHTLYFGWRAIVTQRGLIRPSQVVVGVGALTRR